MDGPAAVDIQVTSKDGRRVAIETDGPSHFLLSDCSKMVGSTWWRNDLVAHAVGGSHNLVCIRPDKDQWLNVISGKSVKGSSSMLCWGRF